LLPVLIVTGIDISALEGFVFVWVCELICLSERIYYKNYNTAKRRLVYLASRSYLDILDARIFMIFLTGMAVGQKEVAE